MSTTSSEEPRHAILHRCALQILHWSIELLRLQRELERESGSDQESAAIRTVSERAIATFNALDDASRRLDAAPLEDPGFSEIERDVSLLQAEWRAHLKRLARLQARSRAAMSAKARVLIRLVELDQDQLVVGTGLNLLAHSVACDLIEQDTQRLSP